MSSLRGWGFEGIRSVNKNPVRLAAAVDTTEDFSGFEKNEDNVSIILEDNG